MENSDILLWWLIALVLILPTSQLLRLYKKCKRSDIEEVSVAIASVGGFIILVNALFEAFTQDRIRAELFSILEAEGTSALLIGSMFALRLFTREVTKLFPPSENLDERTCQLIDRMLNKGLSQEVIADITQISKKQLQNYINSQAQDKTDTSSAQLDSPSNLPIIPDPSPLASQEKETK